LPALARAWVKELSMAENRKNQSRAGDVPKGPTDKAEDARPSRGIADGHTIAGESIDESEMVTETSEESFPASDPPARTVITGDGAPKRKR
jgi:hypothetical protein